MRWVHIVASLGALTVVASISLSDRYVPATSRQFSGGSSAVTSAAADRVSLPLVLPDLPIGWDTLTHFLLWMGVGIVSAGFVRKLYQVVWLAVGLFAISGLIEYSQQRWTDGRSADWLDLLANGFGITTGLLLGLLLLAAEFVVSKIAAWIRRVALPNPDLNLEPGGDRS